jgi:hypothetical protein
MHDAKPQPRRGTESTTERSKDALPTHARQSPGGRQHDFEFRPPPESLEERCPAAIAQSRARRPTDSSAASAWIALDAHDAASVDPKSYLSRAVSYDVHSVPVPGEQRIASAGDFVARKLRTVPPPRSGENRNGWLELVAQPAETVARSTTVRVVDRQDANFDIQSSNPFAVLDLEGRPAIYRGHLNCEMGAALVDVID